MKTPDKKKVKKSHKNNKPISKEKVARVAQELKFARALAGNEKKSRDRVLKTMKKWLVNCFDKGYEFKEEDFIRMWKGLFYAMWMSDKPLVQEELCESISSTLDLFPPEQYCSALLMMRAGLRVLATEWYGLDQHRMDKFLMLVRRLVRASLRAVRRLDWDLDACTQYTDMLTLHDGLFASETPAHARNAISLQTHICECFIEELAKVSRGELPDASLVQLMTPWAGCMAVARGDLRLITAARRVFTQLVRQSDPGLQYLETRSSRHGRASGSSGDDDGSGDEDGDHAEESDDEHSDEQLDDENDDDDDGALDPRAGHVDAVLCPLPVPGAALAAMLRARMQHAASAARTRLRLCAERFEMLSRDVYPFDDDEQLPAPGDLAAKVPRAGKAAKKLIRLERRLIADSDELALRGLGRKHRKRLLARSRAGLGIADELRDLAKSSTTTDGNWQVEETVNQADLAQGDSTSGEVVRPPSRKRKPSAQGEDTSPTKRQRVKKSKKPKKDKLKIKDKSEKSNDTVSKVNAEPPKKTDSFKVTVNSKKDKSKDKTKSVKKGDTTKVEAKKSPTFVASKVKSFQKQTSPSKSEKKSEKKQKKSAENCPEASKAFGTPKAKLSTPKANFSTSKAKLNTAKGNLSTPKANFSTPKANFSTSKANFSTSQAKSSTPKANFSTTKAKSSTPKANFSTPQAKSSTPKKVKFVLKSNSMQDPLEYYRSVRQSPSIPFDSTRRPSKTNLKANSTPSPINPFFNKKSKLRK